MADVAVILGSSSDSGVMKEAADVLKEFGVPYEVVVCSAHRSPRKAIEFAQSAADRGLKVIIAGAGGAAHLAGTLAAHTVLPVIGVPIDSSPLQGMDSLLSTAQMPAGVPVATMAVGTAGARNAGVLAVQILGLGDEGLRRKLAAFKEKLEKSVETQQTKVERDLT